MPLGSTRENEKRLWLFLLADTAAALGCFITSLTAGLKWQLAFAAVWVVLIIATMSLAGSRKKHTLWLLLLAPLALGKLALAIAFYLACTLDFPAGCP